MRTQPTLEQLNIRIPNKLARELATLADAEHIAKIDIVRQPLWEGIARWKQEVALKLYEHSQVSKSRAAEIAGLSSLRQFREKQTGHAACGTVGYAIVVRQVLPCVLLSGFLLGGMPATILVRKLLEKNGNPMPLTPATDTTPHTFDFGGGQFDNSYARLPQRFYARLNPTPVQ